MAKAKKKKKNTARSQAAFHTIQGGAEEQTGGFRDYSLLFIVLFLLAFGLVMLYSTSSYEAAIKYGDAAHWLKRQLGATVLGLVGMLIVTLIPYRLWKKVAPAAYGLSVLLVLAIIRFGVEVNGAKRWFRFFGISLQPAEVAKIGVILVTAVLLERLGERIQTWKGLFLSMGPSLFMAVLIYGITNNLSSALIVIAIAAAMVFVASRDYKRFLIIGGSGAAAVAGLIFYIVRNAANADAMEFRGRRILAWLDPQAYAADTAFQTLQGLYAIGSGGVFGKGLGQSMQKLGYIPEAQNDMIFSIVCEELGMFGAISIILMFILLIWRFLAIANNAADFFGGMVVTGVMAHIAVQAFLNIAVVTNTIPNTGVTLPFISYGGTSILFLLMEVGLCLSVGRGTPLRAIES